MFQKAIENILIKTDNQDSNLEVYSREQISLIDEYTRTVYFRMYSTAHSYAILDPRSCSVTLKSRSLVNGSHSPQS